MLVQVRFECKSFVTSGADKWFGVGVGLNVSSKVGLVGKRLFANVACERFFPCKKNYKMHFNFVQYLIYFG